MVSHVSQWPLVVVFERDEATLELLCDHLTADRFNVLPAPTAADALRLCRYNDPDLMLLDAALPDASELDVVRDIRQADGSATRFDPQLPIIVMSGRSAGSDSVRGLEEGVDDLFRSGDRSAWARGEFADYLPGGAYRSGWYDPGTGPGVIGAFGSYGQVLLVDRRRQTVIVRQSSLPEADCDASDHATIAAAAAIGRFLAGIL